LFCGGGKFFYLLIFSRQISVDLRRHHRLANILGFSGGKKKHQVFSPAAADET
jgi:hypothetical protein